MSEDSGQSATGQPEEEGSQCASPTPSLTPSLPVSLPPSATPVNPTAPATPGSEHSAAASSASVRSDIGELPRPRLSAAELESISLSDLIQNWKELDAYTEWLDNQAANQEAEIGSLRAYVDRTKTQHVEACARERAVLRRLATKEQEIQELMSQITDLKTSATPSAGSLRSAFLDPAVNLLLQKLRSELVTARAQLEETQNELSAWKFTPDSNTGKRLMAKCRLLYQENEELGKAVASGRMAKLEGELALQKTFSLEVKKSQSELDEFLQELDEDVEGMQSTVYYLQQELRKSGETISSLEKQLRKYKKESGKGKGKRTRLVTNEAGEQVEEEVDDDDEDEDDEQEVDHCDETEPKEEWKECAEEDAEGWGGEEGEEWNQWEEEETERHDYTEEETAGEWTEDGKRTVCAESKQVNNDTENSPKVDSVSLKRTKSVEELDDKFETPVRKKLKPLLPSSDISKEFSIIEGLAESTSANTNENV
ncbi:pre-mRNA-splicing regulator WTAP [Thrips palmi]|uniref:Pre-mRNA-splicing regulator WTAP n=1 Tax=Thrips palmi TaxID=161013 RepID=A0A6P8Z4N6_THRPL|nr:pre-mRNA-splicing regulator WTAP [Thrips palmi]XP_034244741.1 pre-mRNA-splicing regulator WTAP [Thrips palmi]